MVLPQDISTDELMAELDEYFSFKAFPLLPLEIIGIIGSYLALYDAKSAITACFIDPIVSPSCLKTWSHELAVLKVPSRQNLTLIFDRCKRFYNSSKVNAIRIRGVDTSGNTKYQGYIMNQSGLYPVEMQAQKVSTYSMERDINTNAVQSMTSLEGYYGLYRYGSFSNLKELSLFNTSSYSFRQLSTLKSLTTIYFFTNQDAKNHKQLKKVIADPSVEYPVWLMQAMYTLRKTIRRIYLIMIQPCNENTVTETWVDKTSEVEKKGHKYSSEKGWKINAIHYTFHCNQSMSTIDRIDTAKELIKQFELEEEEEK